MAKTTYAGMTKQELHAAIAKANAKALAAMDAELAGVGYADRGITRMLIANRQAELAGKAPVHKIQSRADLPPISGRLKNS